MSEIAVDAEFVDKNEFNNSEGNRARANNVFLPGDELIDADGYIRGHGTHMRGKSITSTYFGNMKVTNKLVTVDPIVPLKYLPQVGDVVIGRVSVIQSKKWKLEVNSACDVCLSLSAINLPGAVQRRKLESDEIVMRSFFDVGDLVVSEVQKVSKGGMVALHARNEKYGKLSDGILVIVPYFLLDLLKTRFLSRSGIDVIVGCNGYIWIGAKDKYKSCRDVSCLASSIRNAVEFGMRIDIEKLLYSND
ncbi:Rrp4-like RNA-binding protein [Ordospora colligata]|uniref:Rrp4-like RNA-binding protein n=1 Tax=Ordospora colligata OC4 TaxID=1354746 RepID=A0A0B2UL69_9MICR|nr:Rrp4-like RNA-binding protein [Ordospora colligata OC4]KHN69725.1 Rrp4-like RNA-binding protein [Ordospora colligata OC4]TBU15528.1 Rrp4-like RNA-binding protein [Ordospora colligata]TBU15691.1 Rrp4-like RNA-binding protein [Ordospora colligata]TBU18646.1 Rrp4-like RNA-binding protein [Ordospora colligata]